VLPPGTQVELTGRLGGSGFFRFQIVYQNQLYWVGSWNIRVVDGNFRRLLDTAYLYPYGRLVRQLEQNIAFSLGSFQQINSIWRRLDRGDTVTCAPVPQYVPEIITVTDAQREGRFVPAVIALNNAISGINDTISAFEDACNSTDPNFVLTRAAVTAEIDKLADAERNLILASSLLEPLRIRNPLLSTFQGNN
jgi:hypothetical protein